MSARVKTGQILPASAVWFINFNLARSKLFCLDTAVLQPAEVQFRAISLEYRLKLNLHAAEADGVCDHLSAIKLGSS